MGLDTVELVNAIEEEFGIEIRDADAEKMTTVGEIYNYLLLRINKFTAKDCLKQKVFYKFRRALVENYGLSRKVITPDTKLDTLLTVDDIKAGWPFMQMLIDLETPDFEITNDFLGMRLSTRVATMRELVGALVDLNYEKLLPDTENADQIWKRLVDVIVSQLNVSRDEVVQGASITRDLGAD